MYSDHGIDQSPVIIWTTLLKFLPKKKNKEIKVIRKSSFDGPLHVEVGTTQLMLRNLVAKEIIISQE